MRLTEEYRTQVEKRRSRFEDFEKREMLSCGDYLPDTEELLYAVSRYEEQAGGRVSRVFLRARKDGTQILITAGGTWEGNPRANADGSQILFVSDAGEWGNQLYLYRRSDQSVTRLTAMRYGVSDPLWSPDSRRIVFTSAAEEQGDAFLQEPVTQEERESQEAAREQEPVVITDFGYKFDGLGFSKPLVQHLWVLELAEEAEKEVEKEGQLPYGHPVRITRGQANFLHANWMPDSRHVICESNLFCEKSNGIAMDVLLVDCEAGEMERITKDQLVVSYPNPVRPVAVDEHTILVGILDPASSVGGSYPSCTLYRIDTVTKEQLAVSEKTEECFDTVQFPYNANCGQGLDKVRISSDQTAVLFHSGHRGEARIWRVAIDGKERRPRALASGKYAYHGMGEPKRGRVLVTRTSIDAPEAYYLMDEQTGEMELLYASNADWKREIAFSQAEDFFFRTLDQESEVHGFCLPPQQYEKGKKYPTIVYVHGGPHPFYTYGFDLELQCFAGVGFGVIYCNPRGSSGYGDIHRNLERSMDGSAYTDILQFVREAATRCDWIDEGRLGLTGGSYGGYMTNYAATRASCFRAYISQRAVVSDLISYASSDMQGSSAGYSSFGEFMKQALKDSVVSRMERVKAPFLILHGMEDLRCPVEGARQLYAAIRDSHPEDFPVKLVLYPHCSHEQPSNPQQRQHYYRTMVEWFQKYL